ncbi:MAG: GDP-mannose 4,6-dehydratase, partial [Spirochaetia bacterium]|nr:GDP-mannose 4,6-dehydratase [Spirochaetia bacterium]
MPRSPKRVLVTGGAGFIGVNFIRHLFHKTTFKGDLLNLDALTYAGNPHSLADIEKDFSGRYRFFHADILDKGALEKCFDSFDPDMVVHFAAESHVDRSIHGPEAFVRTNVLGTFQLLEAARKQFKKHPDFLFHHISTDEVYGSLGAEGFFYETTAYSPNSPYSASKAGSDHLVRSYHHTYGLPVTISNCSNNYGPYQFPEKLIPVVIENILEGKPLPVYGDGKNVRDWLHVEDHAAAIWLIVEQSPAGET